MHWIINGRYLSQSTTGVQRYSKELVCALDAHHTKNQFTILAPSDVNADSLLGTIPMKRQGTGKGYLWEQVSLPLGSRCGLISLCNMGPILHPRQIVCIHDANVWQFPSSYSRRFRIAYKNIIPALAKHAKKILTVSRSSADALIGLGIAPAHKIELVPNGHEHVFRWNADRSQLFNSASEARRPFVFAVGSRAPHKNINLLLRIAPYLDDLGLDIYLSGGTYGIFASQMTSRQHPNVRMLGYVSDDDLALLYQTALCLVFPSFVEGFGLPLIEAMAFGCNIVSSNTSCMPEICGNYADYADPNDPDAWVKKISRIFSCQQQELNDQARLGRFRWSVSAQDLDNIAADID